MWWKLILVFTVVPAVELYLLLQIGSLIGPLPTFVMLLVSGAAGAWLARREGSSVLRELSADLQKGLPPADRLAEGALVLLGAVLLITPGVLTDVAGLLIVFPPIRRRLAPRVVRSLSTRFGLESEAEQPPLPDGVRIRREPAPASAGPGQKPNPFSSPFD